MLLLRGIYNAYDTIKYHQRCATFGRIKINFLVQSAAQQAISGHFIRTI